MEVKSNGFGRAELDPVSTMRAILDVDPKALMLGADLPSTRARRPFQDEDFDLIRQALTPVEVESVFWENAAKFCLGQS